MLKSLFGKVNLSKQREGHRKNISEQFTKLIQFTELIQFPELESMCSMTSVLNDLLTCLLYRLPAAIPPPPGDTRAHCMSGHTSEYRWGHSGVIAGP